MTLIDLAVSPCCLSCILGVYFVYMQLHLIIYVLGFTPSLDVECRAVGCIFSKVSLEGT